MARIPPKSPLVAPVGCRVILDTVCDLRIPLASALVGSIVLAMVGRRVLYVVITATDTDVTQPRKPVKLVTGA